MKTTMAGLAGWSAWMLLAWTPCSILGEECKPEPGKSTTGTIKGTVRLTNPQGSILNTLCQPPREGQGFDRGWIWANSVEHDPQLSAHATIDSAKGCVEADFEIQVEACKKDGSGIRYRVGVEMSLDSGADRYQFEQKVSDPVKPLETVMLPPFEECAGMLDIRWMDKDGNPDPVTGGEITAYRETETGGWQYQARKWRIPDGTDQEFLAVRGDGRYKVVVLYDKGKDFYSDRVRCLCESIVDVACDAKVQIVCETCKESLGKIVGQVDFLGKEEHPVGGYTLVEAQDGPFDNRRLDSLAAIPSSGAFELENLVASETEGYRVYAEMRFGLGRRFQAFRTPSLGYDNPRVMVKAGSVVDLASTFVVDPGLVQGSIVLAGPRSSEERTGACLEDIYRASDTPGDVPGLPRDPWLSSSSSYALGSGVASRAGTAQFSSDGGYAMALFEGEFEPGTGRFEGDYELALGGLNKEASLWSANGLRLLFRDTDTPGDPESYQYGALQIVNERSGIQEIAPGSTLEVPHRYCFGQVYLCLYSTTGKFYQPHIRPSQGSFEGEDFEGNPAKYRVFVGNYPYVNGTPLKVADASNLGLIVLCLPQGKYKLDPWVTYDTPSGPCETQLPPIDLDVGCGEIRKFCDIGPKIDLDPILRADSVENLIVSGQVKWDANVTKIAYSHNKGEFKEYCRDCGPNPPFSFPVTLVDGENTIKVTAETGTEQLDTEVTVVSKLTYFMRGDPDGNGKVDVADVVHIVEYLFKKGDLPGCLDAADANDDGRINIADPVFLLWRLFHGGGELPPPSGKCGPSTAKNRLSCFSYACKD